MLIYTVFRYLKSKYHNLLKILKCKILSFELHLYMNENNITCNKRKLVPYFLLFHYFSKKFFKPHLNYSMFRISNIFFLRSFSKLIFKYSHQSFTCLFVFRNWMFEIFHWQSQNSIIENSKKNNALYNPCPIHIFIAINFTEIFALNF